METEKVFSFVILFLFFSGTPHVWLDIKDCPIDNTYVALPEESELHLEYFYNAKKANYYKKTDPLTTKLNLYLGSEETTDTTRHNLRGFFYHTTNEMEFFLIETHKIFFQIDGVSIFFIGCYLQNS